MRMFLPCTLLVCACSCAVAQETISVSLRKIAAADVVYETPSARICFSKNDILSDFNDLKDDRSFIDAMEKAKREAYATAIEYLKNTKGQIALTEGKNYSQKELQGLQELIKIRSGARLLNDGRVDVYRKATNTRQDKVQSRQLADSPDGAMYAFSFADATPFFSGGVYGELTLYSEDTDDKDE